MTSSKHNTPLPHSLSAPRPSFSLDSHRLPPARESLLPFGSCQLCLQPARNPAVACATNGDLFCRECAVRDLLAQRQDIRRGERERAAARRRAVAREEKLLQEAREKEVQRFEQMSSNPGHEEEDISFDDGGTNQNGKRRASLLPTMTKEYYYSYSSHRTGGNGNGNGNGGRDTKRPKVTTTTPGSSGDQDNSTLGHEKRRSKRELMMMMTIEQEKEPEKPSLPSFWVPSLTPSVDADLSPEPSKTTPICPGSTESHRHGYSLKTLIDVRFTEETPPEETGIGIQQPQRMRICPSCKKVLTSGLKAMLAKPCGHVICLPCVTKFMMPQGNQDHDASGEDPELGQIRCYVCEADVTPSHSRRRRSSAGNGKDKIMPGLVELRSDGRKNSG